MPRLFLSLLLSLGIASSASAVTMDWNFVGNPGNPGNPADDTGFGAVGYAYSIGTYEVTNAQYAEFLNAKAASDPLGFYNVSMANPNVPTRGGITRSGVSGSYTYNPIPGREDMPVNHVSFFDALRFANWLNNGQGSGDTETGAYTLLGGTATPSNGTTVTRNSGANIFLPSEDEWYKAAYYGNVYAWYFDYPAGSNTQTACATPTATANRANCDNVVNDLTIRGSYTGSASPYGTFDQGGNVSEWNEAISSGSLRGVGGGSFDDSADSLAVSGWFHATPESAGSSLGFRLVMIPAPGAGVTFDFDDFPNSSYVCTPIPDCSLGEDGYYFDQVSITRDGLTLTIAKDTVEFWYTSASTDGWIIDGGDPSSLDLFHLTFSPPVSSLTLSGFGAHQDYVDFDTPYGGLTEFLTLWFRAYLYDANGVLLEDFVSTDQGYDWQKNFTFNHPSGIADVYVGNVLAVNYDCIENCPGEVGSNGFTLDNIIATPVPEPSTAVLRGTALIGLLGLAVKRKARA